MLLLCFDDINYVFSQQNTDLRDFFVAQLNLKKKSLGEISEDDIELSESESNPEMAEEEDEVDDKDVPLQIKFIEKVKIFTY